MVKAKEIEGLDYGAGAGDGIRLILRSRFEEMRSFRDAALDWSDIEGVHDMRVASRRLRSALRDFMPYLRERKFRRSNKALMNLADALGAVRDQDVAITALEKLAADAPAEVSAGIEQFADKRRLKRDIVRSRLEQAVTDEALAKLEKEFNSALEDGLKVSRRRPSGCATLWSYLLHAGTSRSLRLPKRLRRCKPCLASFTIATSGLPRLARCFKRQSGKRWAEQL